MMTIVFLLGALVLSLLALPALFIAFLFGGFDGVDTAVLAMLATLAAGFSFGGLMSLSDIEDFRDLYKSLLKLGVWVSRGGVFHDLRQEIAKDVQRQEEWEERLAIEAAKAERRLGRSRRVRR